VNHLKSLIENKIVLLATADNKAKMLAEKLSKKEEELGKY
jgi:hypothetical protein